MTSAAHVYFSVSTWQQPMPGPASPSRARVIERIATLVAAQGRHRLRVAIDGFTAAGKTTLGHELARTLAEGGRPAFRASLDDFKRPWSEAHRYDRTSGEGYYRNAFDIDAIRMLLLEPSAPGGDGKVALCSIDPLTQVDHSSVRVSMPADGVLVVDGVFAYRPELDAYWDVRIWVDIEAELSVRRGTARDADMEGGAEAAATLHRDRYLASELLYIDEVDPRALAEVIIDNTEFDTPRLIRPSTAR
jgi:uridine kinase